MKTKTSQKKFTPPSKVAKVVLPPDPTSPHPRVPEMRRCDYATAVYHAKCYGMAYKTDEDVLKMHRRLKAANADNYAPAKPVMSSLDRQRQAATISRAFGEPAASPPVKAAEEPAKPAAPVVRGPGVIDTIIKVLTEEASKLKPMSKAKLLKRLTAIIPGRDPEKMASTIRAQLADSGLKAKGVRVRTDGDGGYWIRNNP